MAYLYLCNEAAQSRTQSLLLSVLWFIGTIFDEFAVHQGEDGRKLRCDSQKTKIFQHDSNKSCKYDFF